MKNFLMIILAVMVVVEVLILQSIKDESSPVITKSLETYAKEIFQKCQTSSYKPTCYEEEVPKLLDKISLEDTFKVTGLIQNEDQQYVYCHVLGHKLSTEETKKDPAKWKEVISRCPAGVCSNGCIHGAFQERFRTESLPDAKIEDLKSELGGVCEQRVGFSPTSLGKATCYHALGHLTMYITEANIKKSLVLCDDLAKKKNGSDFSPLCFDGVFMQIYQPLEPEDFDLISGKAPNKDNVEKFCSIYESESLASCWSEAWPLFWQEIKKDPNELVNFCYHLNKDLQEGCLRDLFYVLSAQFNFDQDKIKDYCLKLPKQHQGQCFASTASRMIETDYRNIERSISFCKQAVDEASQNECFEELLLYADYNFHKGSLEQKALCASLPPSFKSRCPKS